MKIETSLDWQKVSMELADMAYKLPNSKEMIQMAKNIDDLVQKLSIEEISCRRLHKQTKRHKEILDTINEYIHNYESMITFGLLLGK